jgi:hypothetical protein
MDNNLQTPLIRMQALSNSEMDYPNKPDIPVHPFINKSPDHIRKYDVDLIPKLSLKP